MVSCSNISGARQTEGQAQRPWGRNCSSESRSSRCEQGRRGTSLVRSACGGRGLGAGLTLQEALGGAGPPITPAPEVGFSFPLWPTGLAHPPCPLSSSSRSWLSPSQLWDLEKPPLEDGSHGGMCPTGLLRGVKWAWSARPTGCPEDL